MTVCLIVFVILLFTGLPLFVNLGLSSFLYIFMTGDKPMVVVQRITQASNSFTMLAAPFFILMGNFMNTGGVTKKLFRFAREVGYADDFSCAITSASAVLGPILPPSLPMVILCVTVGASTGRCFIGGIGPGILMAVSLGLMVTYYAIRNKYPKNPRPTRAILWEAFRQAFFALMSPIILFVAIYTGIVTTTEAAIIAALYSLIIGIFWYKDLKWKDIPKVILSTCETTGSVLSIVMTANIFGYVLTVAQVPQKITMMLTAIDNKYLFLLVINLFLLFVGCFMEGTAAILILSPILFPVMAAMGVPETQACLIIILNLMIGVVTPPVGIVRYVTSNVAKVSANRVIKATIPFLLPLFITLMIVTYVPAVTNWLPSLVYGG